MTPDLARSIRLQAFLAVAAGRPFAYGEFDCALMPADWCASECSIDPASPARGLYKTEADWQRLADAVGGLVALWQGFGIRAGLQEIAAPAYGDIGLVEIADLGIYGAIKGKAARWLVKLDRGIVGSDFAMIAAWEVPCRKQ